MSVCRLALRLVTLALLCRVHMLQTITTEDPYTHRGTAVDAELTTVGEEIVWIPHGNYTVYSDRGYVIGPDGTRYDFVPYQLFYRRYKYMWTHGMYDVEGIDMLKIAKWYKRTHSPNLWILGTVFPVMGQFTMMIDDEMAEMIFIWQSTSLPPIFIKQRENDFIIYGILVSVGVLVNGVMLATILKYKQLQTPTNYFLASMAVGDILFLINESTSRMIMTYYATMLVLKTWHCRFLDHTRTALFILTVIHNLAIAAERYFAICWPMKVALHCSAKRSLKIIAALWMLAFTLPAPRTQGFHLLGDSNGYVAHCQFLPKWKTPGAIAIGIYMVVPLFLIPVSIMVFFYIGMTRSLLGSIKQAKSMKGDNEKDSDQLRSRYQVVKLLWIVFGCFTSFWLPNRVMELIWYVSNPYEVLGNDFPRQKQDRVQKIAFANSIVNPIIFFFMSRLFRNCVLHMVSCGRRTSPDTNPTSSMATASTMVSRAPPASTAGAAKA